MNEIELKNKFIDFLKTNNNHNFFSNYEFKPNNIIEIKNEGLNRKFDLILAMVKTKEIKFNKIKNKTIEIDEDIKDIFFRGVLLKSISEKYKIKIQNLIIYPIEIKSDRDKLDERLANQIIEAILTFGRSIVILDNEHTIKIKKNGLYKVVPSTILGYIDDKKIFFLLNKYNRVFSDSLLNINKINLIRTLERSKVDINYNNLYRNLRNIQKINQKLIYNQIFNYETTLFEDEIEFIKKFSTINQKISFKKEIINLVKESKNYKITEFIN
ncbi:MAG: hypothetical protein M3Z01_06210 [Thermoproteota archaeon]|nr:hypothetical protein [Thermoproteota archaeon]